MSDEDGDGCSAANEIREGILRYFP